MGCLGACIALAGSIGSLFLATRATASPEASASLQVSEPGRPGFYVWEGELRNGTPFRYFSVEPVAFTAKTASGKAVRIQLDSSSPWWEIAWNEKRRVFVIRNQHMTGELASIWDRLFCREDDLLESELRGEQIGRLKVRRAK